MLGRTQSISKHFMLTRYLDNAIPGTNCVFTNYCAPAGDEQQGNKHLLDILLSTQVCLWWGAGANVRSDAHGDPSFPVSTSSDPSILILHHASDATSMHIIDTMRWWMIWLMYHDVDLTYLLVDRVCTACTRHMGLQYCWRNKDHKNIIWSFADKWIMVCLHCRYPVVHTGTSYQRLSAVQAHNVPCLAFRVLL